ncbi:MAG: hypothetical protein BA871_08240 [Desulfuromonadales bacterium C00003096]|jgi:PHD/YefM family antitoxin component YafN of YafNO toxin-antitoxin module|nr:MAG: hypothetical protein BA871_08240 [Desulfuromonadales bacterium C00003096]
MPNIQYLTDESGKKTGVVLSLEEYERLRAGIESETDYLLKSPVNRARLLEAINRKESISEDVVYEKLGIRL